MANTGCLHTSERNSRLDSHFSVNSELSCALFPDSTTYERMIRRGPDQKHLRGYSTVSRSHLHHPSSDTTIGSRHWDRRAPMHISPSLTISLLIHGEPMQELVFG